MGSDVSAVGRVVSAPASKAAGAFRTISEVAEELAVPQHVLRFWETKFSQIKPLKRGGGRRYYRPEDVALLRRIHQLLYSEGYTIKGAQKLLRGQTRDQVVAAQPMRDTTPPPAPASSAVHYESLAAQARQPSSSPLLPDSSGAASGSAPSLPETFNGRLSPSQRVTLESVLADLRSLREEVQAHR